MKRRWLVITPLLCLAACSIPTDQPVAKKAPQRPVVKVADESRRFTSENRVKIDFVKDHLLGKDYLPGGNPAEYKQGEKSYQQFLTRVDTPDKAAFLLGGFRNEPHGTRSTLPTWAAISDTMAISRAGVPERTVLWPA